MAKKKKEAAPKEVKAKKIVRVKDEVSDKILSNLVGKKVFDRYTPPEFKTQVLTDHHLKAREDKYHKERILLLQGEEFVVGERYYMDRGTAAKCLRGFIERGIPFNIYMKMFVVKDA